MSFTEKEKGSVFNINFSHAEILLQEINACEKEDLLDQALIHNLNPLRHNLSYPQTTLDVETEIEQPSKVNHSELHSDSEYYAIEEALETNSPPVKKMKQSEDTAISRTGSGISPIVKTRTLKYFTASDISAISNDSNNQTSSSREGFSIKRNHELLNLESNVSYLNITRDGGWRESSKYQSSIQVDPIKKYIGSPPLLNEKSNQINSLQNTLEGNTAKRIVSTPVVNNLYHSSPNRHSSENTSRSFGASIHQNYSYIDNRESESIRENKQETKRESIREIKRERTRETTQETRREFTREAREDSARETRRDSARETREGSARQTRQDSARQTRQDSARQTRQDSVQEPKQDSAREPKQNLVRNKHKSFSGYASSHLEVTSPPKDDDDITVHERKYRILSLVGKGGSGNVYKAFSETHRDIFALKWIPIRSKEEMEKVKTEIKTIKLLKNSNHTITLYDHEITSKVVYMIMEYGSKDFAYVIQLQLQLKWDIAFIKYYWKQMLFAVRDIHNNNIVHSDLKPANFVVVDGFLKLIDFGIAEVISDHTNNIARDYQVGTKNFMAPETLIDRNEGRLMDPQYKQGRSSDIWSLGCILYQMIYAKPPFYHLPKTIVHKAIINPNHEIPFPEKAKYGAETIQVPVILLDLLKMCLDRNPDLRPTTAALLSHSFVNS